MEKKSKDNFLLKNLDKIQNETLKLQDCLRDIVAMRLSMEADLDAVEKQLFSMAQEEYELEAVIGKDSVKIEAAEKEIDQLEEEQSFLSENIIRMEKKIKRIKENSESKINSLVRESQNLCKLFLSTMHNETEEEHLKTLEEINKLKTEITRKEYAVKSLKNELVEFIPENDVEEDVTFKQRQLIMYFMQSQLFNAKHRLEDLNLRSKTEMEEGDFSP